MLVKTQIIRKLLQIYVLFQLLKNQDFIGRKLFIQNCLIFQVNLKNAKYLNNLMMIMQIEAIQFFQNDIKPWWEDENNKNGGLIQFDIPIQHQAVYDSIYQDILLQILGQATQEFRHINGLRVLDKINAKQDNRIRIELWMDIDPKDQDESIPKLIDWIDSIELSNKKQEIKIFDFHKLYKRTHKFHGQSNK